MSNKEHQPTDAVRKLVQLAVATGNTETEIATAIGIDPKTLRKHYRADLDSGLVKANLAVATNLFKIATNPKPTGATVTAGIFWLKTRAGWSEYSPPKSSKEEPLGKKAQAVVDAANAGAQHQDWDKLVH